MKYIEDEPPSYAFIAQPCIYLARVTLSDDNKIFLKLGYSENIENDRLNFESIFYNFALSCVQNVNSQEEGENILNSLYGMLDDENVPGTVTTVRIEPR